MGLGASGVRPLPMDAALQLLKHQVTLQFIRR